MKLYLVKSDIVKCRYFFQNEAKAKQLLEELSRNDETVFMKYIETSDEYEIVHLKKHFEMLKGN